MNQRFITGFGKKITYLPIKLRIIHFVRFLVILVLAPPVLADDMSSLDDVTMQVIQMEQIPDDVIKMIPLPAHGQARMPPVRQPSGRNFSKGFNSNRDPNEILENTGVIDPQTGLPVNPEPIEFLPGIDNGLAPTRVEAGVPLEPNPEGDFPPPPEPIPADEYPPPPDPIFAPQPDPQELPPDPGVIVPQN